jgi:hypothetical protein
MSIVGLNLDIRLSLLTFAFRTLAAVYLNYLNLGEHNCIGGSGDFSREGFFAEKCDLRRYMKTIIIMRQKLDNGQGVVFHRMGTHTVENMFRLVRLGCRNRHEWKTILDLIAKAGITDEILNLNGMKTHVRREVDILGMKVGDEPAEELYR